MKLLSKIALTVAASAVVMPAFAFSPAPFQPAGIQQYHDDHNDDHHDQNDHRDDHRDDHRGDDHDNHANNWHPDHGNHWERGRRYDGRVVIVNDYRSERLREPPRGYRWQRADNNDFILVAVATGVIADIITR